MSFIMKQELKLSFLFKRRKDSIHPVVYFTGEQNGIEAELAFQFNDGYSENILSFVNNTYKRWWNT